MAKLPQEAIDSTISMEKGADSIPNLTPTERDLVRNGTLYINMDMKKDKFLTKLSFPFHRLPRLEILINYRAR